MIAPPRAWMLAACLLAAAPTSARATPQGELARYLAGPDASYTWREVKSHRLGATDVVELVMTSQTWRGIPWKHQLVILFPSTLEAASTQAFLFIHGGRWKPEYENGVAKLPREARIFTKLAETLRAPVAVLRQVPFQPMFDRREDALIAYTFDHYLETGESDWPLLLPMVKSAVRAMDAVQTFSLERRQHPVDAFTVAGASKRGWTSWLTAAVDPRVASVAPIAIDMLNLPAQIELQRETFGALSEQVQDYVNIDLPGRVNTERGRSLMAMVDPYLYREDLAQPKLILLGTNDRYWPLDALKLYWDELPEPKRVLYVPNQGTGCGTSFAWSGVSPRCTGTRRTASGCRWCRGRTRSGRIASASTCSRTVYRAASSRGRRAARPGIFARRTGPRTHAGDRARPTPAASLGHPDASRRCTPSCGSRIPGTRSSRSRQSCASPAGRMPSRRAWRRPDARAPRST